MSDVRVRVRRTPLSPLHRRRYLVSVNDRVRFTPAGSNEVLPYIDWAINWEVPWAICIKQPSYATVQA